MTTLEELAQVQRTDEPDIEGLTIVVGSPLIGIINNEFQSLISSDKDTDISSSQQGTDIFRGYSSTSEELDFSFTEKVFNSGKPQS